MPSLLFWVLHLNQASGRTTKLVIPFSWIRVHPSLRPSATPAGPPAPHPARARGTDGGGIAGESTSRRGEGNGDGRGAMPRGVLIVKYILL